VRDTTIIAIARAGSFLAVTLTSWYTCQALHIPFLAGITAVILILGHIWRNRGLVVSTEELPAFPLLLTIAVLSSPTIAILPALLGTSPHWLANSDDAYTLLIARGLRHGFPPVDLSWNGATIHYHLGGALLTDLISRATALPVHAIYYGVLPLILKIIAVASILVIARDLAPDVPSKTRAWIPLAVCGVVEIDWFAIAWHVHDFLVRGLVAFTSEGMPVLHLREGLFSRHAFDAAPLAALFVVVLAGTWQRTTLLEKASLLFCVYLAKQQVFLAAGAAYAIVSLLELARRRWQPFAAGSIALLSAVLALRNGSTYGSMAHMSIGCGALCRDLMERHGLAARLPAALHLPMEICLMLASLHLFLAALIRRRRSCTLPPALLLLCFVIMGPTIAFVLKYRASPLLKQRFLTVYAPISAKLFMPLAVYLDRILEIAVQAAATTLPLTLAIVALPLGASWMSSTPNRGWRYVLIVWFYVTLVVSAWSTSVMVIRGTGRAKEIGADTMSVLSAIPANAQSVLTNDLQYDDHAEQHLPLLNIWAPLSSGRQFYASAFMFNFQYPDSGERLRIVRAFVGEDSDSQRLSLARTAGIDTLFWREQPGVRPPSTGWKRLETRGMYSVYALTGSPPGQSGSRRP